MAAQPGAVKHYFRGRRALALLAFMLLGLGWRVGTIAAAPPRQAPVVSPDAVSTPVSSPQSNYAEAAPVQQAQNAPPRYVVKAGDTLWRVALEVGLDVALMPCTVAPDFSPDQPLVIGNTLDLLPPDQWCHTIQAGETLATIAALYGITPEQIYALPWNQLHLTPLAAVQLQPGRQVRIPLKPVITTLVGRPTTGPEDARSFLTWMLYQPVNTSPFTVLAVGGPFAEQMQKARQAHGAVTERALRPLTQPGAVPANWPYGSGVFTWPLAGWLTQGYRYDHRALDIAAPAGTLVTAADRGVVLRAGWNDQGYGLFVIIDHNIDYITLYAHLSELFVEEGQVVAQGAVLGKVGSTGNSTGPHLHFEIRDFGRLTNPLELLVQ